MNRPVAASRPDVSLPWFDQLARRVLVRGLAGLTGGTITLDDGQLETHLGEQADLHLSIRVHRPRFFRQAVLGGSLSVAESYLNGDWDCDDLTALFRLFIRNGHTAGHVDRGLSQIAGLGHRLYHWWRDNSPTGSRKNIHAHYDLGNDFFRLWLDDTMAYSSGVFPHPHASMHEASREKFDRVCRKLDLSPDDELIEIGTGWGGFSIHAAQDYGCRITTTTISQEQYAVAHKRIERQRLGDRVTLLQRDYRDLEGSYDKLVSIEMIEAVGHRWLDTYFRKCSGLLRPTGSLVLQAIVMPDNRYGDYLKSVDFIQRYVFPGGCLPSIAAMLESAGRATDLRMVHLEDFAPHYAETLRRWRTAFHAKLDAVREQGFSEYFIRLWDYYLCYCEAVFEERHVGVVQVQFDKPQCRRDPLKITQNAAAFSQSPSQPFSVGTNKSGETVDSMLDESRR